MTSQYSTIAAPCAQCGAPLGYSVALDAFFHLESGRGCHTPAPNTSLPPVDDVDLAVHLAAFHERDLSTGDRIDAVTREHSHKRRTQ